MGGAVLSNANDSDENADCSIPNSWTTDPMLEVPPDLSASHETLMRLALREAERALEAGEVPVGAVIVHHESGDGAGRVIGAAYNQREQLRDPTAHAEMIAITQAAEALGSWRLSGCTLYVTLEPCPMCAGAIVLARMPRLVFGAADPKAGAVVSLYQLVGDPRLNHRAEVVSGVLAGPCGEILSRFFQQKRRGTKGGDY
jgi:tRNA(adenine34) deaminase